MQNTLDTQEKPRRKQIAFDLSEDKLKKKYPRSKMARSLRYYKKTWSDIARFMAAIDFEHRQYSVYDSKIEMVEIDVYAVVMGMVKAMPWLSSCLDVMDVTDIGEYQDLLPIAEAMEIAIGFELENAE